MAILAIKSLRLTDDFQRMAQAVQAPLPWTEDENCAGRMRDANGEAIICIMGRSDKEASAMCDLIALAMNTCGGFKATRKPGDS